MSHPAFINQRYVCVCVCVCVSERYIYIYIYYVRVCKAARQYNHHFSKKTWTSSTVICTCSGYEYPYDFPIGIEFIRSTSVSAGVKFSSVGQSSSVVHGHPVACLWIRKIEIFNEFATTKVDCGQTDIMHSHACMCTTINHVLKGIIDLTLGNVFPSPSFFVSILSCNITPQNDSVKTTTWCVTISAIALFCGNNNLFDECVMECVFVLSLLLLRLLLYQCVQCSWIHSPPWYQLSQRRNL